MGQGGRRQCRRQPSGAERKMAVQEVAEWDKEEEGSVGGGRVGQDNGILKG